MEILELNNRISRQRKAVQCTEVVMLHRGVGSRMLLDKAPGWNTGPEIRGFFIQSCGLVTALTIK